MKYTAEEQYEHDGTYFIFRMVYALCNKTITSADMVKIIRLLDKIEKHNKGETKTYLLNKGVEISHVGYDDDQLGRNK